MGRIVVSDNVSLDGVVQDPAGDEGFERGGWVGPIKDRPELATLALEEALVAQALLLGRRSYDWFASRWPARSGELADRVNSEETPAEPGTMPDQEPGTAPEPPTMPGTPTAIQAHPRLTAR
jgi:dihydrofolate reductase